MLAALLLAAQGLGLAHRALHGGSAQGQVASAWLDEHEAGSADCRLIDQLGHADLAVGTQALAPCLPTAAAAPAARVGAVLPATPALAYSARAPPQATTPLV
jgi:hypothetical protein